MALVTKGKFIGEWCDVIVWIGDEFGIIVNNKHRQFTHIRFVKFSLEEVEALMAAYKFNFYPFDKYCMVKCKNGRGYRIVKDK